MSKIFVFMYLSSYIVFRGGYCDAAQDSIADIDVFEDSEVGRRDAAKAIAQMIANNESERVTWEISLVCGDEFFGVGENHVCTHLESDRLGEIYLESQRILKDIRDKKKMREDAAKAEAEKKSDDEQRLRDLREYARLSKRLFGEDDR